MLYLEIELSFNQDVSEISFNNNPETSEFVGYTYKVNSVNPIQHHLFLFLEMPNLFIKTI